MVRADCELMCNNCLKYNTEDTPFHGLALKMLKETERIIQVKRNRFIDLNYQNVTRKLTKKCRS